MAVTSGISVLGVQTLQTGATAPLKLLSIAFPNTPLPPVRRYGYFWLFQYRAVAPFQCFIVEEGLLRAPGVLLPIRLAPLASDWQFRLDAEWKLPLISWTASLA